MSRPRPSMVTFANIRSVRDLHAITVPTLIVVGDRDPFCSIEEGASVYRALPDGELAVLPNTAVGISPAAVQATIQFFQRRLGSAS